MKVHYMLNLSLRYSTESCVWFIVLYFGYCLIAEFFMFLCLLTGFYENQKVESEEKQQ